MQVETCQENIFTLELQDPITNSVIDEAELAALIPPPPSVLVSPSDDENSSIVTVQSTGSNDGSGGAMQLHFSPGDEQSNTSGGVIVSAQPPSQQQVADHAGQTLQTVVEVVNPLISGDGVANRIAVGHSLEPTYPSLDENDNGNAADDEYDSINSYNPGRRELSLNDKMKNVLQELVTNERVRLSFSQSLTDDNDGDDDEEDNDDSDDDTDDDDNDSLQHDSDDELDGKVGAPAAPVAMTAASAEEPNGNIIASNVLVLENPQTSDNDAVESDNLCFDATESSLTSNTTFNDTVYENPNFLASDTPTDDASSKRSQSEHDEKLKEKLLSELNIGDKRGVLPAAVDLVEGIVGVAARAVEDAAIQREQDDDNEEDDTTETTNNSTAESASKSSSASRSGTAAAAKRKKRKSKSKKK